MLFFILISKTLAFWPFGSALDEETAFNIINLTVKELGAGEEESRLLAKAYLETNKQISMESLVQDIQSKKFSQFITGWRRNLFKGLISQEVFDLSERVEGAPFNYEIFKALTMTFEEYSGKQQASEQESNESQECPDGSKNSYHI
jgi:hypothetical protein